MAEVTEDKSQGTGSGEGGPQDGGTVSCSNMQVLERSRRVGFSRQLNCGGIRSHQSVRHPVIVLLDLEC